MTGRNLPDFDVLYAVFDALIDFEPKTLELKPGLAKSWKFTDPKTLVLDLVEGVKFHDGTEFDGEVVKFNIERYKSDQRSNVKADLSSVDSVEVNGKHQVTFKLNKANAGLPNILTNRVGLMVSPKAIQAAPGGNVDRTAVGTGPFKFVSWQDNDSFTLVRNADYWKPGLPISMASTSRSSTNSTPSFARWWRARPISASIFRRRRRRWPTARRASCRRRRHRLFSTARS